MITLLVIFLMATLLYVAVLAMVTERNRRLRDEVRELREQLSAEAAEAVPTRTRHGASLHQPHKQHKSHNPAYPHR